MKRMLSRLWQDDGGALIATEFLFVATILVIGLVVGLANLREAINIELTELGNAILTLSQGYTISGQSTCVAQTDGSQAIDTPNLLQCPILTPPVSVQVIDCLPCQ